MIYTNDLLNPPKGGLEEGLQNLEGIGNKESQIKIGDVSKSPYQGDLGGQVLEQQKIKQNIYKNSNSF